MIFYWLLTTVSCLLPSVRFDQVKVAAGAFDDEGLGVVVVVLAAELPVVHEAEIDAAAGGLVEGGGHRDGVARDDRARLVARARVRDVREVRGDGEVRLQLGRERDHLAHAVDGRVAVLLNQQPVRLGDGVQVRRVDYQLAALVDDAAELVARLAADPKLVVVLVEQRDDSPVLAARVLDVDAAADSGRAPQGFAEAAAEESVRAQAVVVRTRDYRVERDDARGHEVCRRLYHVPRGRLDAAYHALYRGERAEPVRRVRQVRPRDAGEEILRAAREARDLVRHGRAEDEHGVVSAGREQSVEVDPDRAGDEPARQLAHALGRKLAEVYEFFGAVPLVVEDVAEQGQRRAFRDADLRALLRLGHGHVRALRDERVELLRAARGEDFACRGEEHVRVVVARLVGDDGEHARPRLDARERLSDYLAQLRRGHVGLGRAPSDD